MLEIHFLNVGHGDCTIIRHPSDRISMIDINNGKDIDDDSYAEICSQLESPARSIGPIFTNFGPPAFASLLPSPTYRYDGLGALTGALPVPLMASAGPQLSPGLLAALAARPDKRKQLKDVGYDVGLTNPVEYFLNNFPGKSIHRYIQTHPDLDHMRGLSEMIREGIRIVNFWDTKHAKQPDLVSSDYEDWDMYRHLRKGISNSTPLYLYRNALGASWNYDPDQGDDHDSIEILSPSEVLTRQANEQQDYNKLSYVLRITYAGRSIILGGDADESAWEDIASAYGAGLKCDVLKASHHGRDSGYEALAARLMSPSYTVVSVGKKPETDASNKYRRYGSKVWSTRWYGNLTLRVHPEGNMGWFGQYVR